MSAATDLLLLAALGAGGYYLYKRCARPGARCLPSTWRDELRFRRTERALTEQLPLPQDAEPEPVGSGAQVQRPYRTARATPALRAQLISAGFLTEADA